MVRAQRQLLKQSLGAAVAPTRSDGRLRVSSLFFPTLHQTPQNAVTKSHILLSRAGLIRQVSAGMFTLLPLGQRVVDKISNIINEEMSQVGASRISMPSLTPAHLWEKSGRWTEYGSELFRVKDSRDHDFALSPTHEECITSIVTDSLSSYRQLPARLYQIGPKYRDEARSRHGLMRAREFLMKDLYTFDDSLDSAMKTYELITSSYHRIFQRLGMQVVQADADTGAIGGNHSHEFHILSPIGEDTVLACMECGYVANREKATFQALPPVVNPDDIGTKELTAERLDAISSNRGARWEAVEAEGLVHAVLVKEDRKVNRAAFERIVGSAGKWLERRIPNGREVAFVHVDAEVASASEVGGAYLNDAVPVLADCYAEARKGDVCSQCRFSDYEERSGLEVGHTFVLQNRYSLPFSTNFDTKEGTEETAQMGCYGLGITRIMAAIAEVKGDDHGIAWPLSVAPYRVAVLPIGGKGKPIDEADIARVYDALTGVPGFRGEVILDDRAGVSPGVMMKDAALVGYPFVVVLGRAFLEDGRVEVQERVEGRDGKKDKPSLNTVMSLDECVERLAAASASL